MPKCLILSWCVINIVSNPRYKVGDYVKFFCKYKNEEVIGEIVSIRQAHLNWDYNIRYQIYTDLSYVQWIEEKYIIDKIKK